MRTNRRALVLCVSACLLLASACSGAGGTASTDEDVADPLASDEATAAETDEAPAASEGGGEGEALTIDVGTPSDTLSSSFYAFIAAQELGYWEEENLTVNLVPGSGSGALVEQVVAGNLPVGAPSLPSVVEGLGAGLELVDFYTYSYGSIFGIWVPQDSDVQDVEGLAGRNVGISEPGGGETAVLNSALQDVGIDAVTGVNLIPVGSGDATTLDAISSGRVDAYSSSKNDSHSLVVAGLDIREITPPLYEGFPGRALITTPEALEANREAFVRLARGIARGTLFCDNNIDACEQFMRDAVPEQWVDTSPDGLSQGSLQYEEAVRTTTVPEGEQFGRHNLQEMAAFRDVVGSIVEGFQTFDPEAFMVSDLLTEINDFDRDAVIEQAESYGG